MLKKRIKPKTLLPLLLIVCLILMAIFLITNNPVFDRSNSSGFKKPLVTITFDDGYESQFRTSWPVLDKYGYKGTFFITTGFLNTDYFMSDWMVQSLKNNGNQIAAHTVTHPHLISLSDEEIEKELYDPQVYLRSAFDINSYDFSAPFGEVDNRVLDRIRYYYRSHRGVLSGYNRKDNFDIYNLLVQNVLLTTTTEEVRSWLEETKNSNAWLILVYHQNDYVGDTYSATPESFSAQIQSIYDSGMTIVTFDKALNEILPQL